MKFLDTHELNLFFVESGRISKINKEDFTTYEPEVELLEGIFIKRQERKKSLGDFRKSQDTEGQWRGMKYKMLRGIRRFHRSTEGKRQHRAMARFLATREFRPTLKDGSILSMKERSELITDMDNYILSLNEFQNNYFHPIDDHFDLVVIKTLLSDICESIVSCLISTQELTANQAEIIESLVEAGNIVNYLSDSLNKSTDEVAVIWEKEKAELLLEMSEFEPSFYSKLADRVTSSLKK